MSTCRINRISRKAIKVSRSDLVRLAFADLRSGASSYRIIGSIASQRTRLMYRRTLLGPIWFLVEQLIFSITLGLIMSQLFGTDPGFAISHVAIGVVTFSLLSDLVVNSSVAIPAQLGNYKNFRTPVSIAYFVHVAQTFSVFIYRLAAAVSVTIVFSGLESDFMSLLVCLVHFLNLLILGVGIALMIGTLSVRFRDVGPILNSVMRLLFLATPIVWSEQTTFGAGESFLLTFQKWNPAAWYVEGVRWLVDGSIDTTLFIRATCFALSIFITGFAAFLVGHKHLRAWA